MDQCLQSGTNGQLTAASVGKFYYAGGHMEKHASLNGKGAMNNAALAADLRTRLGQDIVLFYTQPQLAGGVVTTAANYGLFLRKLLGQRSTALSFRTVGIKPGVHESVDLQQCRVQPGGTGGKLALHASKKFYGVLARQASSTQEANGLASAFCGRLIRKAWTSGIVQ